MRKNPRVRELLDINYWHGRIGPALTDTMFIVLLQGLHLPFLLSTSERYMYDAAWFRPMPLTTREILSVLYNNALGLFADNWADCVAHAKWLTNMYLRDLAAQLDELSGDFTEVTTALSSEYFVDDETTIIPLRFKANAEQASALFDVLQNRYAGETARLEAARQRYLETAEAYYFKSMIIAMTISVVGAGKSLPGDSTHFTFAAGETDFTLAVTLLDFKRHPLYHVWELLFSGAYAMVAGPFLAQRFVAPAFSSLGLGSGALETMRGLMQEEFRKQTRNGRAISATGAGAVSGTGSLLRHSLKLSTIRCRSNCTADIQERGCRARRRTTGVYAGRTGCGRGGVARSRDQRQSRRQSTGEGARVPKSPRHRFRLRPLTASHRRLVVVNHHRRRPRVHDESQRCSIDRHVYDDVRRAGDRAAAWLANRHGTRSSAFDGRNRY